MPCRPDEPFAQGPEDSDADEPKTLPRKRVTVTEPLDAEETNSDSNSDA